MRHRICWREKVERGEHLYAYKAKCTKVIDGDTLDIVMILVLIHGKRRVRLLGVDERSQTNYKEATQFTRSCVENKDIIFSHSDSFGRYLESLV